MKNCTPFLLAWAIFIPVTPAFAQTPNTVPPLTSVSPAAFSDTEKQAYCQNAQDTAEAEEQLATGIISYARLGQSDTDPTLKQAVIGLSKSLSRHLQGKAALRVAVLQCQLYAHSLDVSRVAKYKLLFIEHQVAALQVSELPSIIHLLDTEIIAAESRRDTGNGTLADIMVLTQQRLQLHDQYATARNTLTAYIPDIPDIDIEQTLQQINNLTRALQEEINGKQSLQAWDINFTAGMERPILGRPNNFAPSYKPFVGISFSYNLNAEAYKRKLADSVASLMELQRQQSEGLTRQVQALQSSMSEGLITQRQLLIRIKDKIDLLKADQQRLQGLESADALRMQSQIRIQLAATNLEAQSANLKINLLAPFHHAQN